jgi:hypothetical protein
MIVNTTKRDPFDLFGCKAIPAWHMAPSAAQLGSGLIGSIDGVYPLQICELVAAVAKLRGLLPVAIVLG